MNKVIIVSIIFLFLFGAGCISVPSPSKEVKQLKEQIASLLTEKGELEQAKTKLELITLDYRMAKQMNFREPKTIGFTFVAMGNMLKIWILDCIVLAICIGIGTLIAGIWIKIPKELLSIVVTIVISLVAWLITYGSSVWYFLIVGGVSCAGANIFWHYCISRVGIKSAGQKLIKRVIRG